MSQEKQSETTKYPSNEDFIRMLEDALEGCRVADAQCDFDWEIGLLQEELGKLPKIFDENGGI